MIDNSQIKKSYVLTFYAKHYVWQIYIDNNVEFLTVKEGSYKYKCGKGKTKMNWKLEIMSSPIFPIKYAYVYYLVLSTEKAWIH